MHVQWVSCEWEHSAIVVMNMRKQLGKKLKDRRRPWSVGGGIGPSSSIGVYAYVSVHHTPVFCEWLSEIFHDTKHCAVFLSRLVWFCCISASVQLGLGKASLAEPRSRTHPCQINSFRFFLHTVPAISFIYRSLSVINLPLASVRALRDGAVHLFVCSFCEIRCVVAPGVEWGLIVSTPIAYTCLALVGL